MAPPVQNFEDFFLTESRWQRPSSRGEDTIFNRFTFNLLYYQINYLLFLIVNLCLAELAVWDISNRTLDWISTRNIIHSTCLFLMTLVISICFHAFLRMPNVKIVDRIIIIIIIILKELQICLVVSKLLMCNEILVLI